uniref:Nuclear receptor domain-containing protein n=1 Tax=Parascaris univalens TaxID=6257 RepID=A0A915A7D9_PARUN
MNKELIQLPKNYDTDRIGREQFVLNNDPNRPISIRPLVAEWPAKQAPPMDRHGDGLPCTAKNWLLCDLVLTVEFAKSFNAFKRLSLHDKLVLLRNAAAANFSMMQSYYS